MDDKKRKKLTLDSRMVFYPPEEGSMSVSDPIYMASNFQYTEEIYQRVMDGERKAVNIYSRCGNPSEYKFEEQMIYIENGDSCLATASGMAAIAITLFGLLKAGDHIVADWTTYSTTHEFLDHRFHGFWRGNHLCGFIGCGYGARCLQAQHQGALLRNDRQPNHEDLGYRSYRQDGA